MGWWFFTRTAIAALTRPRPDIAASDSAIAELAHDSVIGGVLHRFSLVMQAGWAGSGVRSALTAGARPLTPATSPSVWRLRGWIAAVSGATVLGLDAVKPVPAGPLAWFLPSLLTAAGLLTMAIADPLARAVADRGRRGAGRAA